MARWRQDKTGKLIPIDEAAARSDGGVSIHGIFEPFRSVVDGTVISTAKQLREHNLRNNVVSASEFTPEFYEQKARERARLYVGNNKTAAETHKCRQQIYETWMRAERNG